MRGFTLLELLIALVILAIISSIAVSTFSGSGEDAERSRIIAEISSLNDAMARYYQGNFTYADATEVILRTGMGTRIDASEQYEITLDIAADGQSYFIWARPKVGGTMEGKGAYSVNNLGQRCSYTGQDLANAGTPCTGSW